MKTNVGSLAFAVAILTVGCGPSGPTNEERAQVREQERQEIISQANVKLDAVAQRHNAVPVEFFGYGSPLQGKLTATIQQELEGTVVVFRGYLLDVRRSSSGDYEAIFGKMFSSSTTVHLSLPSDVAGEILSSADKFENKVLVVARIERVARHQLSARVCSEPDCDTVNIKVGSFFPSYQIWGQMIDLTNDEPET